MGVKILALDVGFASAGMAVMDLLGGRAELFHTECLHTKPEAKKRGIYVAHDDVRRTAYLTREILRVYLDNSCKGPVVELPSAGAQGAKANRCMGIATGMIAAMVELVRCPAEWITPQESRTAAIGRATAPKGEDVKKLVMAAMAGKYPEIAALRKADQEHIADALATYEAAKDRQMIRTLEQI